MTRAKYQEVSAQRLLLRRIKSGWQTKWNKWPQIKAAQLPVGMRGGAGAERFLPRTPEWNVLYMICEDVQEMGEERLQLSWTGAHW